LVALNALPSMCVGRSPAEAIQIVLDALPTALSCQFVYISLPGSPPRHLASLDGTPLADHELMAVQLELASGSEGALEIPGKGKLWYYEAELPLGSGSGRLVAGKKRPLEPDIDRVLIRSAANLVGTTLESANVLDAAHRKDEFLAMLGHELRNPLAPIITAVELLARHPSAAHERQVIDRHTSHLARLVDDLLDISRVTRGHLELRSELVSLSSVLERAVEMASQLIAKQQHSLQVGDAKGVMLKGDPVRLAQIFGNLLTNAAKFTPPRGTIDVSVERSSEWVEVMVRDNGRGIPSEQMARIFEPFVQVDRKADKQHGGLGLGLAIVNSLVEPHGGSISAQSEGLGRGTAFTVRLPIAFDTVEPAETAPPQERAARAGFRVLIVDDNVDVADLLSLALKIEGFQTAVAHDAREALKQWRSFAPHAAVLDVGLPELDGYELAKALRAEHGSDPTLIAATGYGEPRDRVRAAEAGFNCHFVKPVRLEDLLTVLDQRVVSPSRNSPGP
jgi:signal transduction histidine kinase/ActR/RegA family two-component response regulator